MTREALAVTVGCDGWFILDYCRCFLLAILIDGRLLGDTKVLL